MWLHCHMEQFHYVRLVISRQKTSHHDKLVLKPKELHLMHFGGDLNINKDTNHVKTKTPKIRENWRRNQHEASFFNVKDHPNKNQNDKHGNYIFFPSKLRSEVEAWLQWRTCKCAAASAKKLTQDKRSPPDSGKLTVSHHVNTTILSQTNKTLQYLHVSHKFQCISEQMINSERTLWQNLWTLQCHHQQQGFEAVKPLLY